MTGAEGFTGNFLVSDLEKWGFDSAEISSKFSKEADLLDKSSLAAFFETARPDHIIHLAAISNPMHVDKDELWSVNVLGTKNLLTALDVNQIAIEKFILASSSAVYDHSIEAISEESAVNPTTIYAESKLAAEELCLSHSSLFNVVIVRPFNYTGLGQSESFFVPKIIGALKRGEAELRVGNLEVSRDFSDVRDIVRYYRSILKSEVPGGTYNLCSGTAQRLEEIATMGLSLSGASTKFTSEQSLLRSTDNPVVVGSNKLLQATFGVSPEYSLGDTLSWMLQN